MIAVMVIKWLILLVRDYFADNLVKSTLSQLYFSLPELYFKKNYCTYFILFNGDRIFFQPASGSCVVSVLTFWKKIIKIVILLLI